MRDKQDGPLRADDHQSPNDRDQGGTPGPRRFLSSYLAGESAEFGRYGSPKWKTSRADSERRFHYLRPSEAVKSH